MKPRVIRVAVIALSLLFAVSVNAGRKEITAREVPRDVIEVLNKYLSILTTSPTLEECAKRMAAISAGHMLSHNGGISDDVFQFNLKKDYQNAKFYKVPAVITRVQVTDNDYDGYGPTLFEGTRYKIWIANEGT